MAGIIDELLEVLIDQKTCYEGLVTLATYKTQAVTEKNIDVLNQVVEREEAFIGRVNLLDQTRETLLKDIALIIGSDYKVITVRNLIEKIGEEKPVSKQLTEVREALLELMEALKKQNAINTALLNQSMEYVDFTINAIKTTQFTETQINYIKPGTHYEEGTRRLFDQKQ